MFKNAQQKTSVMKKILKKIARKVKTTYANAFDADLRTVKKQLREFKNAPDEMLASKVEEKTNIANLIRRFEILEIPVEREEIDIADFKIWMNDFPEMCDFYKEHHDVKIEKLLEHYLTAKKLGLDKKDIYVDIAACNSPFSEVLRARGINAYEQDLINPDGIAGHKIGGDASAMPVSDDFADILSLQCAFECFQGDSDMGFTKEAGRVLKKGGRLGILPLYVDDVYFVKTGPKYNKNKVKAEKEARWIWRDDFYLSEPFSRHYSPESFKTRVYDNLQGMTGEIIHFTNLEKVKEEFVGQRIYCHFMFRAIKK
jgi:SAM-dependent methyltransferase